MRSPESSFNGQTNNRYTNWTFEEDKDGSGQPPDKLATERYKTMLGFGDAATKMSQKVAALLAAAFLAMTVAGVATSGVFSTHEIMGTNSAENVETIRVESVTLTDGPNIRSNPNIPNREDGSTVIMDFGEEGQVARISYQGEAYYYHDEHDANGGWYGFPADEFADELFENAFISQKEANRLKETDDDGVVWVNEGYVDVHEEDTI